MLPSEMTILMATVVNKKNDQKMLTHSMDVTGEYIVYLYNSLVNRGYLKGYRSTGYRLTPTGREAIPEFLKKNQTRAKDVVKGLQLLGIEFSLQKEEKIGKLQKKAMKAK